MECLKGSFWAPLILLYTVDLDVIVTNHGLMSHFYADDSQLYLHRRPDQTEQQRIVTIACIMDRDSWMKSNRLLIVAIECIMDIDSWMKSKQAATESCKNRVSVARNTESTSLFQRQSIYPWQHHRQAYHHRKKSGGDDESGLLNEVPHQ